ncbi:Metallo-hydrolase/oxidoreductase, partial [Pleomassaria siparia CBS 279.74]
MSSTVFVKHTGPPFPRPEKATVSVHALSCGHFSLPEYQFVHPVSRDARKTVPSLAFLIQHHNIDNGKVTRIVFDLGLRRDIKRYATPIQKHVETRQPMTTTPDAVKGLAMGGLTPEDVDYVIYSHVHWDHIGEPRDFTASTFIVGSGAAALLNGTSASLRGGHSFFEHDLLPHGRKIELSDPEIAPSHSSSSSSQSRAGFFNPSAPWQPFASLPQTLDVFGDGSLYIVNAPGHLPGHINILAQTSSTHRVYLAGDACHDRRLLTGEKEIGEWQDNEGHVCCIHADRARAEETIERIRVLERDGVEIIFAHDVEWASDHRSHSRRQIRICAFTTPFCNPISIPFRNRTIPNPASINLCSASSQHYNKVFTMPTPPSIPPRPPAYTILSDPPDMSLTPAQQSLKERFDAQMGDAAWDESWARLLRHSPEMFAASLRLSAVPKKRGALSPKIQALVLLSVASASTHLHVPNIHRYTRQALLAGASKAEIVETLCLTCTLGIHACNIGVPILFEVLREAGQELPKGMEAMSEQQWKLKEEFEQKRGYWHAFWEDFLRLSPDFFGAYVEFSSVPWTNPGGRGVLEPKVKELIYCAFDAAATHLYQPGLKLHMQNVLKYGGTADEIMEVLELATLLSISTMDVALPVLEEEMARV